MAYNGKKSDNNKTELYVKGKSQFVNPFNFVPVSWKTTGHYAYQEGQLSGVLHCSLLTRTPIAVPDTDAVSTDMNKHKTYPFMRDPFGNLMIPGSSLRGAIRSVYETITDSCFVTSVEDQKITRRAGMYEHGSPGLLKKEADGWKLYKANRFLILIKDKRYRSLDQGTTRFKASNGYVTWDQKELDKHSYGDFLTFEADPNDVFLTKKNLEVGIVVKSIGTGNANHEGYLYKGEVPDLKDNKRQSNKHFESIFEDTALPVVTISAEELDDMVNALLNTLEVYNDPSVNRCLSDQRKVFYRGAENLIRKADQPIPVWYNEDTKQLSMASIGRVAYHSTMGEIIQTKKPCSGPELCKACALFGTAREEGACASRIRVTDAVLKDFETEETTIPSVTLKELSGPKISYLPFYLDKKGKKWSYDKENGNILNNPKGRKYYWHNSRKDAYKVDASLKNGGKTERNATMELVSAGQTFKFDIYFDRITDEQLNELKWAVTLGENKKDSKYCYKIGHGKPIGLGSVKIMIEEIETRSFCIAEQKYEVVKEKQDKEEQKTMGLPESIPLSNSVKSMLKIMDFEINGKNLLISYPFIDDAKENDNNYASHQWFSAEWKPGSDNPDPIVKWKNIDNAFASPFYSYRYVDPEGQSDGGGKKSGGYGGSKKGKK